MQKLHQQKQRNPFQRERKQMFSCFKRKKRQPQNFIKNTKFLCFPVHTLSHSFALRFSALRALSRSFFAVPEDAIRDRHYTQRRNKYAAGLSRSRRYPGTGTATVRSAAAVLARQLCSRMKQLDRSRRYGNVEAGPIPHHSARRYRPRAV